ncbi:hypothetical protein QBC35DRAFT_373916, partial [Podospora australis]
MASSQGTINKQPYRYELTTVYKHPEAKADIVLVHGLNGDPQKTWTARNGVYWPTDLLPASLKQEHANIVVYGYNADVYSSKKDRSPSDNFIHQHAQSLVASLTHHRKSEGTERHPIIWVAHSLGGILTKRALLYSHDVRAHHHEDFRSIFVSTYGIIFLGTPHNGSDIAIWGRVLQMMSDVAIPRRIFETQPVLLRALKKDNETLQQINVHFLDIYQRFRIHMVHENHTTDVRGTKILVVDAASAGPQLPGVIYYGIEASHSGMCKFESENAPGYKNVSMSLREWVADAPNVIPIRWEVEEDERRQRADLENYERTRAYVSLPFTALLQQTWTDISLGQCSASLIESAHSDHPPELPIPKRRTTARDEHEPLFIHPETFRPNSFFIGREDELRGLHEMLMDRKRRSQGTSAVLIQSLPGGGKTHLARQYVFQHIDDYPGGVYWVRSKSRQEMEQMFWRIAKNEALGGLIEQRDAEELRDPKKIIQIVRRWLNSQSGWLVVFDGVQFDTPGLHEFIPDARNTSMIYTSTERAVTGDPRFDNPQVMELGLLTPKQARDLLFLELDKKQPWTPDEEAKALELVLLMGRLPLMIHVAAQHLKATREPLARYLMLYRSRPQAGGLHAYKAVRDQLEHRGETAALNLISLLVFFDQHIPVEMLALGIPALDKVTPVRTRDAAHRSPSLNNTLRVLIAFALVERTQSDDISPSSSSRSSKRSFDKHADYLDLLRIHSVVQAFFIDTLHEKREVHFWLERATAIWCRSYDEADRKIHEDARIGLPDDYRRFAIHGEKLRTNFKRFGRRYPGLAKARGQLTDRLTRIQGHIENLSSEIQRGIVEGSLREQPASVFDRIRYGSAASQSGESSTLPSGESQSSWEASLMSPGIEIEGADYFAISDERETPYPTTPLMPPVPPDISDDDRETVVPPPVTVERDAAGFALVPPSPLEMEYYDYWQEGIPNHRVLKRQESKRYHDRAGSWRDKTVSDPRVGLSQEIAMASLSARKAHSKSPVRGRITARSDAEMELNKIKLVSPPSSRVPNLNTSAAGHPERPHMLLGRNSYAAAQVKKAPETEFEVFASELSSGLAQILSSPKSWTAATVKKLRESILPKSTRAEPPSSVSAHRSPLLSPEDEDHFTVPPPAPGPIFRGSRSANSSPAQSSSPFPPPTFSAHPAANDLVSAKPPPSVRRWETNVYTLPPRQDSGTDPIDPLSFSYPSINRPPPPRISARAQQQQHNNWLRNGPPAGQGVGGYSSQPMSRDTSHRSNLSSSSPLAASPAGFEHQQGHSIPGAVPVVAHHHSPLATAAESNIPPSSGPGLGPRIRRRPPSITETEPSPRLEPVFPDVDTSYS